MTPFCPHNNKRDPYLTRVRSQLVCLFMSEKEITSIGRRRRRSSNSSGQTNLSWDHFYETLRPVLMEMLFVSADASKFPLLLHKWWWLAILCCSLDWLMSGHNQIITSKELSGQERELVRASIWDVINKLMVIQSASYTYTKIVFDKDGAIRRSFHSPWYTWDIFGSFLCFFVATVIHSIYEPLFLVEIIFLCKGVSS